MKNPTTNTDTLAIVTVLSILAPSIATAIYMANGSIWAGLIVFILSLFIYTMIIKSIMGVGFIAAILTLPLREKLKGNNTK